MSRVPGSEILPAKMRHETFTTTVSQQAWAAGPVFKRVSELEQYGLMVRQEYDEEGRVTCSLVDDISGQFHPNSSKLLLFCLFYKAEIDT